MLRVIGQQRQFYFITSLIFICIAEVFPMLTTNWTHFLIENIHASILNGDSGKLLITMFISIGRNLVIFFLIYMGAMLLIYSFIKDHTSNIFQILYAVAVLLFVFLYNRLYFEDHSMITHLILITSVLLLSNYIPKQKYFLLSYSIILVQIILSLLWLNLVPGISIFGFGTDDLSISVKTADAFLTTNKLLNTLSITFFILFIIIAAIYTSLISMYGKQINTLEKYQQKERELKNTRIALVESRIFKEIHTLVHDLKTPLVSIEGLISLMAISSTNERFKSYIQRIEGSVEKIKEMISEILYEEVRKQISVEDLIKYVTSNVGLDGKPIELQVIIEERLPDVFVNKIRLARAIMNVLENAILSIGERSGEIQLQVTKHTGGVLVRIEDNGPGIEKSTLDHIWDDGFSTKNSSGIGLPFVKKVVENHGGWVIVKSIPGNKTMVDLFIPTREVYSKEGTV